ncbi:hypothetical protein A2673_01145 [Candidatus Kaiserbacteria bacterium RIFCSPHIGHO2_01_FULL_50_13]|uniref:DUF35 domain-containing protein n=1 Tax=Candidatus Kaiserbacteria bacterium RIFCSPLOWO2_01_FULL_50_24 TaxID=1798507 RepID=A0A1F6EN87_9BACT|nr:MAG: hypothetical protein A2673_01145 [Candidatus Kaiserbacteria bacterium RIFCSPHIGHO2_01_FULL_50_13]OGG75108.1 MAG: hypothetical protein A3A34_01995 [Candidatus Kaiserbacteria bacterium RIFCSPLOWO2_01_FULL_50_24]OGG82150.1 MAG: hypothetical protein A3H74_00425 [Candidatus Kaiserbacteria bacterium RIFCSPLOWO2_02_FULL_51_13]
MTNQRQEVKMLQGLETILLKENFGEAIPEEYIVRENPRTIVHRHTYGGLSRFFGGLAESVLWGTVCLNQNCKWSDIWLPPRVHCPDCWEAMEWVPIDARGAKVYTHSTINLPGAGFMLTTPCPLISVEIRGVCTKFMSYLSKFGENEPYIGMPVKPVFQKDNPTYTILDISWVPKNSD